MVVVFVLSGRACGRTHDFALRHGDNICPSAIPVCGHHYPRTTKVGAGNLNSRETALAMMKTTIRGVPTMVATAAPKLWKVEE